jgi:DNA (cytosine-5)-methyltransferase 1
MFLLAASEFEVNNLVIPVPQIYTGPHTVWWAIADLAGQAGKTLFHTPAILSVENQERVQFLHEHELFDLPNELRPRCQRSGHTYPSVYGRLSWDKPAQTITSGFMSPGRGRFIHPSELRTLTPHEAARLQTFPDWYNWSPPGFKPSKSIWAKLIGDAVPPMLAFAVALPMVATLIKLSKIN